MYSTISSCRVCKHSELVPLFSLGSQYVSSFVSPGEVPPDPVPIELVLCPYCSLVQSLHTAPQELLYRRYYWYKSGVTQTMRDSLQDVVDDIEDLIDLRPADIVLDIGSNDGTLLRCYNPGVFTVGVEPAINLAGEGSTGVDWFISDFWSYEVYRHHLNNRRARVITALGMFYDLEDPNQFIHDVALALELGGVFISQLMCLKQTLEKRDLGNYAHEHLEFYSIESLEHLFHRHGLEIFDIAENEVNGGSYRIYAKHGGIPLSYTRPGSGERIRDAKELETDYRDSELYRSHFEEMKSNSEALRILVGDLVSQGKKVWVYGASTKGNVILQHAKLDNQLIQGAAERSPEKWGKLTIGTNIPIYSEEQAREANPDYFLVLPYAFLDEFIERESVWRSKGGKFIVPLPELRIV